MIDNEVKMHYRWTIARRLIHWTTFICIAVLTFTGFYIANPFWFIYSPGTREAYNTFAMADIRFIHFTFGFIFMFAIIMRLYYAFFSRYDADWKSLLFEWFNIKEWKIVLTSYLTFKPYNVPIKSKYNPLQSLFYFLFIIACILQITSGLVMFTMGQNTIRGMSFMQKALYWFVSLMGGYAPVYDLHRLLTWFFIVFFIGHVYMILAHDIGDKKGTVSSMISGYEAEKE